jgi:uncharacterized Zn finger protein
MGWWRYDYKPYVPVAQRRAQAAKEMARLVKKGQTVSPVVIDGRAIVRTFWGKAWCTNLESYSDYANRLPRGRTYARNGSVVHLSIEKGRIQAYVSGSELYTVEIDITALPPRAWQVLKEVCAGKIGSLVELLQGKLSAAVMEAVTDRDQGLFPKPKEIKMRCSCPDSAGMCKHIAAVMYGIGNRLDTSPELLFHLRAVDHQELIEQAIPAAPVRGQSAAPTLDASDLGAIFDIEIDAPSAPRPRASTKRAPRAKPSATTKPAPTTKAAVKKTAKTMTTTVKKTAKPRQVAAKSRRPPRNGPEE